MHNYDKNLILSLYEEQETVKAVAEEYAKANGMEYTESLRKGVNRVVCKYKETTTETNQYSEIEQDYMPSAWSSDLGRFLTIEEFCSKYGLDFSTVRSAKLVTHNSSHLTYNIAFQSDSERAEVDLLGKIDEIISKFKKPNLEDVVKIQPKKVGGCIVTGTYTDVHIGMEPNDEGKSLYGGVWNREELLKRAEIFAKEVSLKALVKSASRIILRDLGDLADGLNGETTRGGHKLPQNMTNSEVFEAAIEFKVRVIESVLKRTGLPIDCHFVCNSNHGGDFDYFINYSVQKIVESWDAQVSVTNYKKFIGHYTVGDHCFILSHGKDDKQMKNGMKVLPGSSELDTIMQYVKANNLQRESKWLHFCKGDSHQFLFDYTTSDDFDYFNYPAFSPSSSWVQLNFKKGRSGFVVESFHTDKEPIEVSPTFFSWKN